MKKYILSFNLNGEDVEVLTTDNQTLLDLLRDTMGLTGTKKGCEEGECGACTIQLDGRAVNACMLLAREVEGCKVVTIEGLNRDGKMHPLQKQFIEKWALQCGYCTPGMIMSAKTLLERNPSPTEEDVRNAIAGNLCRCTGYAKIVEAVLAAAEEMNWEVNDNE